MALIRNGSHQLTGLSRFHGAVGAYGLRAALDNSGKRRNFDSGEHSVSGVTNKAAIPEGFRHPMSWKMGTKAGSLSSHVEADMTFTPTGAMLRGYPIDGTSSFTISTNTPAGELIVSGTGTASFLIDTNNPLLTASIGGTGTASFVIDTNTPILGAEANLVGTTTITISIANADILPLDDSPVLRDATASFTFSGTLQSYAVGHMIGTTDVTDTVTNASVARAVWDELLASHTDSGSAGLALATASSGGVDPSILAAAVWAYVSRTLTSGGAVPADIAAAVLEAAVDGAVTVEESIRLQNAVLLGKVSGAGTGTEVFRDINDTKNRVTATVDSSGNRTAITRDAT